MAWPEMISPGQPGIKRNLNGDVMSVHGVFNYQKPAVERTLVRNGKLYTHRDLRGSDDKIYGAQWSNEEVVVRNARLEEPFQLDVQGFELHKFPTNMAYSEFFLEDNILNRYHAEIIELVKKATGAKYVIPFDHNIRSATGKASEKEIQGGAKVQSPGGLVHNDYTLTGGPLRFEQLAQPPKVNDSIQKEGMKPAIPEVRTADQVGRWRERVQSSGWAIINAWRNIREKPVEVYPFALMDARTASEKDLCVFEIHYKDRIGENYFAASSPDHRWSPGWLHGGPRANFTLHSAFKDPSSPEEGEDRVSCEVRCVCVWEE
ncbi:Uncharacterized protein in dcmA 3'region (Fragment) [Durusdinium trenchii]|uniref:Uncharacterized protein in dcmA 3'region n=1 Tax=Durusdinium trenchii TaxID=1381693 RepID=A0ABP0QX19_9DINO